MRPLLAAALLWGLPAGAAAYYVEAGANQVIGSDSYLATSGYGAVGADNGLYFKPSFSLSESSGAAPSRSYLFRGGYDQDHFGVGAEGGFTPLSGNYEAWTIAGDASAFIGNKKKGKGLLRAGLGVGCAYIRHTEHLPTRDQVIIQTDLFFPADFKFLGFGVSGEYRRSYYNRDIPVNPRKARRAQAKGANPTIFGLPDWAANVQLSYSAIPIVSPFLGYSVTTYKVRQPAAHTYLMGARADLKRVELSASYELYDSGGGTPTKNYFSLGVSANF